MDDAEDVGLVVVHLRVMDLGQAVLDGQGMEVEGVLQEGGLLHRGVLEVDPVQGVVGQQRRVELLRLLDLPVGVAEVGQHAVA